MKLHPGVRRHARKTVALAVAIGLMVLGYVFVALALDREWLYVPGIALQLAGLVLAISRLRGRPSPLWPIVVVVVIGTLALMVALIDVFFYVLFRLAADL